MFGIVVSRNIERLAVFGANFLQLLLQPDGNALGIENIGFRKNQRKQIGPKAVDGVRWPQFAGHRFRGIAPGFGALILFCGPGRGLGLHEQERKGLLHGHRAAIFHGEAIPEMIQVGHGMQEVDAGLMLQVDVSL